MVAALQVGEKGLAARRHPFERALQLARRPRQHDVLGIMLALVAEATADVGSDHPHRSLIEAQLFTDEAPQVMWHLRRHVEQQARTIWLRQHGAWLQRATSHPLIDEADLYDVRSRGKGCIGLRATAALVVKAQIARRLLVQTRRSRLQRYLRSGDSWKGVVAYRDGERRIFSLFARRSHHQRDWLADVAHHAACEAMARRLYRRAVAAQHQPQCTHRPGAAGRHRGAIEHGKHSGHAARNCCVNRRYACVRMRRAHEGAMQLAWYVDVGDIASPPGDEARVLPSQR